MKEFIPNQINTILRHMIENRFTVVLTEYIMLA